MLDFPEEYVRAVPSRRPDIFPDLKEPKTPMPRPMPGDPEMPDEESEEKVRFGFRSTRSTRPVCSISSVRKLHFDSDDFHTGTQGEPRRTGREAGRRGRGGRRKEEEKEEERVRGRGGVNDLFSAPVRIVMSQPIVPNKTIVLVYVPNANIDSRARNIRGIGIVVPRLGSQTRRELEFQALVRGEHAWHAVVTLS